MRWLMLKVREVEFEVYWPIGTEIKKETGNGHGTQCGICGGWSWKRAWEDTW